MLVYIVAIVSIMLGAFAQLLLKIGVGSGEPIGLRLLGNPAFIGGIAGYALSFLLWLYVLSRLELSKAYPLVGLGYVVAVFLGWFVLDEQVTGWRLAGVGLVVTGVMMIAKS